MHYRLIDGAIHAQRASGQDWVPLSKAEANALLSRLSDEEAEGTRREGHEDLPSRLAQPQRH